MNCAEQHRRNKKTSHRGSFYKGTTSNMPNMQKQSMECRGWLYSFANIFRPKRDTDGWKSTPLNCHNLFKLWQYAVNQLNHIGIQARGLSRFEGQRKCQTKAVILRLRQIFQLTILPLFNLLSMGGIFICIK